MPTSPDGAQHCKHWFEGSDECHRCGRLPMMERLAAIVGLAPEPDMLPCVEAHQPCPDRVTWRDKLADGGGSSVKARTEAKSA